MREDADQKNSECGHFLQSVRFYIVCRLQTSPLIVSEFKQID